MLHGFYTDDPSYVLAVDGATGETKWRVERPTDAPKEAPDAYTTPALLDRSTGTEIVVSGADYVTGHDPATGEELWRVGGLNPTANPMQRIVASPVVAGDLILVPSRVKPMLALSAAEPGAPKVVWSTDNGPDVPTPVVTDKAPIWELFVPGGQGASLGGIAFVIAGALLSGYAYEQSHTIFPPGS